ncbi:hypothetical protein [Flavobacterium cyanobacteriorum]|nr:hypothetical protein [Flavobacterium cyanobacteriorum]
MKKNIDLATIKNFILANALNGNVMLMLHPKNFESLFAKGTKRVRSLCIAGVNVIPDNNNEIAEDEIDILEIKFG